MQTDKIPDEIMREAARLLDRTHWDRSPTVERVARALMARDTAARKECAEIARAYDPPGVLKHRGTREGIATAIEATIGGGDA